MTILSENQLRKAAKDKQIDRRSLTPTQTERLVRQMSAAIESLGAAVKSLGNDGQVADQLAAQNPRDEFRGREIIGRDEQRVGSWAQLKLMLLWTSDKLGQVGQYLRVVAEWHKNTDTGEVTGTFEKIVKAAPRISALAKVSDRGETEQMWETFEREDAEAAKIKLSMSDRLRSASKDRYRLNRLRCALSPVDERRRQRLNSWSGDYLDYRERIQAAQADGYRTQADGLRKRLESLTP
jgi:hypothetical protein